MKTGNDFYNDPKWRRTAARVLSHYGFTDQVQKRFGKLEEAELVHHALPLEDFPEYAYTPHNLIPVSRRTHRGLHNEDGSLTTAGAEVARRAARKIGVDVSSYLASQHHSRKWRNDAPRYEKNL